MPDLETLLAEVRARSAADTSFLSRLEPVVELLRTSVSAEIFPLVVGAVGVALHMDDVAAGRWPHG